MPRGRRLAKAQKGGGAQCDEVLRGAKVDTMATSDSARDIGGDGCATRTGTTQGVAEDGTDAAKVSFSFSFS